MSTIKNKNELKQQKKTNFCVYFLNLVQTNNGNFQIFRQNNECFFHKIARRLAYIKKKQ